MALIKTIGVFFLTGFVLVLYLLPGLVFFIIRLFGFRRFVEFCLYKLAQTWAMVMIFFTGCPMTISGKENIPKKGGVCFVSNHVGVFDIMLALAYIGRPFGFIAKKELLLLPGINVWILLLGGLFIDRGKPRSALNTINQGVKRIEAGGAMLVFPEGTRSRGRGIASFHPGSLKLASRSGAPIVPMAITGSYDVFEKTHRVINVPVTVTFLPVVNSAELPPEHRKQLLAEQIHDRIAEVLETHPAPIVNSR
jgi:1-acyl-sn-glycerol-3-phosphate acyltransferase